MAEYLIQDTTLTAIANAVRAKTKKSDAILVSDLAEEIASISTGVELNFEVIGGTSQPSSPKENTIWVNTSTPITNWMFSSTEPDSAEEGMVWFKVGTKSHVEFNALKKNAIQIYPMSTKQYINGAWKDAAPMIYHGSEWAYWKDFLFSNGSQCEEITGGWLDKDVLYSGDTGTNSSINADSMSFNGFLPQRVTANKIDVSDCTRIHITIADAITGEFRFWLSNNCISYTHVTVNDLIVSALILQKPNAGTYSLDVSSLNGSYYVHVGAYNTGYFRVTEIYKE